MLTLAELKLEAYGQWETLLLERTAYNPCPLSYEVSQLEAERFPYINEAFRSEMRKFGDLRRRDTWESAAIQLTAHGMAQGFLEPYQVLGYLLSPNYMNCQIRQIYGDRVIEAMLQFPEVVDLIREGLEQIYEDNIFQSERQLVEQFVKSGNQLPGLKSLPIAA